MTKDNNIDFTHKDVGRVVSRGTHLIYKHTGVIIGVDSKGKCLVVENHPKHNMRLVTLKKFANGKKWRYKDVSSPYSPKQIVKRALAELEKNKRYDLLSNNCQHTMNRIMQGKSKSEAVQGTALTLYTARLFLKKRK